MAFTITIDKTIAEDDSCMLVTWAGGTTGDSGTGIQFVPWADCCVHVTGTFGGATVTIEGSNDGTNWVTLNNAQGTTLSLTAAGLKQVVERPLQIRPTVTGGTTPSITVKMVMRRANPLRT